MMFISNNNGVKSNSKYKPWNYKPLESAVPQKVDFWIFLPSVIAIIIYINGLSGDFVHDDIFAIKNNGDVTGKTPFWNIFYNDFWGKPMSEITSHKSYRWNYHVTGADPLYFHAVNVTLHVIVTYLFVYLCYGVLHFDRACAVTAGVLFAAHPIHTEAVTGIVGRAELLAAVFFLLSLICYIRSLNNAEFPSTTSTHLFVCSLVLAAAAMFAKETGATVLGVSLAFDLVVCCRRGLLRLYSGKCSHKECMPFLKRASVVTMFMLCLLGLRVSIMGGQLPQFLPQDNPASFCESVSTRIMTYSYLCAFNAWLLLAPTHLCYDWQTGSIPLVESIFDARNMATLLFFLVLSAGCWKSIAVLNNNRTSGAIFLSMLLTIVPFIPASNLLFTVGFVLAERVLYIPSFGFCLFVSCGLQKLHTRWHNKRPLLLLAMMLVAIFSCKTVKQNQIWRNRESLFRSGIEMLPRNAKAHYNYGNFMKDAAQYDDAKFHYRKAISLSPTYASAYNNLGTLLDNTTDAEVHYRLTLGLQPLHQGAHVNLGNILFKRGERDEGMRLLQQAVLLGDTYVPALTSMAMALTELEHYTEAERYLQFATDLEPANTATYSHYGTIMSRMGNHEEAAKYYTRAHKVGGTGHGALLNAARSYANLRQFKKAEDAIRQAIGVQKDADSLGSLAVLYYQSGREQDALPLYEEIYKQYPSAADYIEQYAGILGNSGRMSEAANIFEELISQSTGSVATLKNLATIYTQQGRIQEAIELQETAIGLLRGINNVTVVQLVFDQANNYKDLQQYDKALQGYRETLKLNPAHMQAHANTGTIHHMNGDLEKARHHYEIALELDPANTIVIDNLHRLERLQDEIQRDKGVG